MAPERDGQSDRDQTAAPAAGCAHDSTGVGTPICTDCALKEEMLRLGLGTQAEGAALCLSGGGIRSAALCIGVLQAFAGRNLLSQFHYLSTVSGGGYAGAWLTSCLSSPKKAEKGKPAQNLEVDEVERILSGDDQDDDRLRRLRLHANYLTPQPGLASPDTWAAILLWIRNTIVNWTVFLPIMASVAAVPVTWFALLCALVVGGQVGASICFVLGAIALVCLFLAVYRTIVRLPSHSHPDKAWSETDAKEFGWGERLIIGRIVLPAVAWCCLAPLSAAMLLDPVSKRSGMSAVFSLDGSRLWDWTPSTSVDGAHGAVRVAALAALPALSLVVHLAAYAAAWRKVVLVPQYDEATPNKERHRAVFRANVAAWIASCVVSTGLLGLGILWATGLDLVWVAFAGPFWVAVSEVVRSTLYVALRTDALRGEQDREWLARLNATKLVIVLTGASMGLAAVALPSLLQGWVAYVTSAGLLAGPFAAFVGRSAWTTLEPAKLAGRVRGNLGRVVAAAALLFAILLQEVFGRWLLQTTWRLSGSEGSGAGSYWLASVLALATALVGGIVARTLGDVVDLDRFSMHAVYRNRLTRAFLGTAKASGGRRPDLYTRFDPLDDIKVADAFGHRLDGPGRRRPFFHVINVTLNATRAKDATGAERKAEPFTITPLRCGAASLKAGVGAYVRTSDYGADERETGPGDERMGISLGKAVALSGAAVSPNMGYHSSPLVTFVMTLFNVRLGAWLPNPGGTLDALRMANLERRNEVSTLLKELVGASDASSDYVYLSDGGHFDNLGLYEMLRRRCGYIVVVDAAQDENYGYHDLGEVLRRSLIDMGVTVDFDKTLDVGGRDLPVRGVLATVRYPGADGTASTGRILYLKSCMPKDAPAEIRAFAVTKRSFPHVSTANQFFSESDFESYRRLGQHIAKQAIDAISPGTGRLGLSTLFDKARQRKRRRVTRARSRSTEPSPIARGPRSGEAGEQPRASLADEDIQDRRPGPIGPLS